MCRIAGIVSSDSHYDFKPGISRMLSSLRHGGPDDEGLYINGNVSFGHRRLAIIDLSQDGHQPMLSDQAQIVLSFNGEIYNYRSLRKELEATGITFKTKTDTEVIIRAYEQWGTASFNRFEGIFAFALYDKLLNKVLLVRDHVGIKPLYYYADKQELIFASEVKAFTALRNGWKDNEAWRTLFLAFGSLPFPHTTLASVLQLAPGTFLEFNLSDYSYSITEFYKPSTGQHTIQETDKALVKIETAVENALQKNMLADAPLGIFLSGGIDSSLLTLLADRVEQNVKTVSVNFEDASFDERPFQKMILDRTQHLEHHSYNITESVFWDHLEDVWKAMDQPSIDGVNTYFVSQCAREAGLKTVLSGVGADEIFGGYESTRRIAWLNFLRFIPFKGALSKLLGHYKKPLKRLVFLSIPGAVGDYLFLRGIHTPDVIGHLLGIPEKKIWQTLRDVKVEMPITNDDREYVSLLESKIYLSNQLLKDTDYMSMWHGLEVRVPFLDTALLETANSISPDIRYNTTSPKYLLTAPNRNILPAEIIFRKKAGFTFPFALWMKKNPEKFKALLPTGEMTSQIIDDFENGQSHWSKYWSMVVMHQFKVVAAVDFARNIQDPALMGL